MAALALVGAVVCLPRVPVAHHDIVRAEDADIFPFAIAIVFVLMKGTSRERLLAVTLALATAAVYAARAVIDCSWWFRYADVASLQPLERMIGSRHGVASGVMLAATVPLASAVLVRVTRPTRGSTIGSLVARADIAIMSLAFAVAATQSWSARGNVEDQWSAAVSDAVRSSAGAPSTAEHALPVARPDRDREVWSDRRIHRHAMKQTTS